MAKDLKNRLVYYLHDRALEELAAQHLRGRLVDIGCGTKPYADLLARYVSEHIGVDHGETLHRSDNVDLWATAYEIPVADASFDSAICTAALEHLEEPEQALRECFRILRPGGTAIYSVPFIWHLHEEPRDFFRYSKYGLKYLFGKVGFEIIEIRPLSGFWATFGQLFVYNLYRYRRGPLRWFRIVDGVGAIVQIVSFLLDRLDKSEEWTWMYMAVVRKPSVA